MQTGLAILRLGRRRLVLGLLSLEILPLEPVLGLRAHAYQLGFFFARSLFLLRARNVLVRDAPCAQTVSAYLGSWGAL